MFTLMMFATHHYNVVALFCIIMTFVKFVRSHKLQKFISNMGPPLF